MEATSNDKSFKEFCYKVILEMEQWPERKVGLGKETVVDVGDVVVCMLMGISQ